MGTFVPSPPEYTVAVTAPDKVSSLGKWEPDFNEVNPSSPWTLVNDRFDKTTAEAERWATLLEGYLTELNGVINAFPDTNIIYDPVTIGDDVSVVVGDAPILGTAIDTNFPAFSPTPYSLDTSPTVDTSLVTPGTLPTDITEAISWFETNYDETEFQLIMDQLTSDLSSGAGGLGGTIEQEFYDRAVARQNVDNDA
jgi:hypothetical protein